MRRVAVALIDGFADWECAPLMGALRSGCAAEVRVASRDRSLVTSMGGLPVAPELAFDAIAAEGFDAIVFPGGAGWLGPTPDDVVRLLLEFRKANRLIGAICAATGALADVGLLDTIPPHRQFFGVAKQPSELPRRELFHQRK